MSINYKDSGVNIEEGYKAVSLMKKHVQETYNDNCLTDLGTFGGLYALKGYKEPVLISGTDGVGTKLEIAFKMGIYDTVGIDCVAMCINDIICHGAVPLFFLDYIACGELDSHIAEQIVKGVADGCKQSGSALLGGETAEMPGFYDKGKYDIAGFAVGVAEKSEIIDGSNISEGDDIIGIQSSGVHSNGFSLVRKLIKDYNTDFNGKKIGEVLLEPTRIYTKIILDLINNFKINGISNITGGGFYENIPRMFKNNYTAEIYKGTWDILPIFEHLQSLGVKENDMYNTFNMGIGMVLAVNHEQSNKIIEYINKSGYKAFKIGKVKKGKKECVIK